MCMCIECSRLVQSAKRQKEEQEERKRKAKVKTSASSVLLQFPQKMEQRSLNFNSNCELTSVPQASRAVSKHSGGGGGSSGANGRGGWNVGLRSFEEACEVVDEIKIIRRGL